MTNPSSIAQQQKLELIRSKFEIAGTAPEGVVDRSWIRKNIIGLTSEEISYIKEGRIFDKIEDAEVEAGAEAAKSDAAAGDAGDAPAADDAEDLFSGDTPEGDLLTALPSTGEENHVDEEDLDDYALDLSMDDEDAPEKAEKILNAFGGPIKANRKVTNGPGSTHMPNFGKMLSVGSSGRGQDSMNKPYDSDFFRNPIPEQYRETEKPRLTGDIQKMMLSMEDSINISRKTLLSEIVLGENSGEDQNGEA